MEVIEGFGPWMCLFGTPVLLPPFGTSTKLLVNSVDASQQSNSTQRAVTVIEDTC